MPIHILFLEGSLDDAKIVKEVIRNSDLNADITVVTTEIDFTEKVRSGGFDLIISDYKSSRYDGLSALKTTLIECPATPFIFVSGKKGEEAAIEALLLGATDYVLKQKLSRLVPAIKRALEQAGVKKAKAVFELQHNESELAQIAHLKFFESLEHVNRLLQRADELEQVLQGVLHEVLQIFNCDHAVLMYPCDPEANSWKIPVVSSQKAYSHSFDVKTDFPMHEGEAEIIKQLLKKHNVVKFGEQYKYPVTSKMADEYEVKSAMLMALRPKIGKPWQFGIFQCSHCRIWTSDEEKIFEEIGNRITDTMTNLLMLQQSRENEKRLREAQLLGRIGSWEWDAKTDIITWSEEYFKIYGLDPKLPPPGYAEHLKSYTAESAARLDAAVQRNMQTGESYELDLELANPNDKCRWVTARSETVRDENGVITGLRGTAQDITLRKKAEEALFEGQQVFRTLVENSPDIIARYDRNCKRTYVNPVYLQTAKLPKSNLLSTSPTQVSPLPSDSAIQLQDLLKRVLESGKPDVLDVIWPKEDNIDHWYNICAFPEFNKEGEVSSVMTISRDVTDQKHHEKILNRLNRELQAVSNCNQVLLHAEDEIKLVTQVCRIICDEAGYRLAWVGYAQNDEKKSIRIVAKAGHDIGYAKEENFSWSGDDELGHGPAGNAVRMGEIRYVQNIAAEPTMKPWHDLAELNSYRSTIALPLKDGDGKPFGVLAIYSEEVNRLNDDELRLLEELAGDLAFGILNHRAHEERILAEKALQLSRAKIEESEAKYRLIAENTADSIAVFDMDLQYSYISPSSEKMIGYTPEEMQEFGLKKILSSSSWDAINKIYHEELELEKSGSADPNRSRSVISQQICKDGKVIWVEAVVSFIRDEKGIPIKILSVSRDITERKKSELELMKLSRTIVQSPVSVVITDINGNIEFVNPKFTEVTGYPAEEVLGKNPRILKSGELPKEKYVELWDTITSGKIWEGEFHNKKKNGTLFWEKCLLTPIIDAEGTVTNFVAVKEDITEKKKMIDDLVEAKELAEKSNRLKDAFIANISHEIRTPLNGLLGMTSILKDEFSNQMSDDVSRYFDAIDISSQRIIRTVDMILNYSRIQVNDFAIHVRQIDIFKICNDLFSKFQSLANSRGLSFVLENKTHAPIVKSDEYSVIQILTNLIDNAIKYTNSGGVRIVIFENADKQIGVIIQDSGIGIAEEYLQHIFEPYRQEQLGYGRAYEGVGLGMALVKKIVDLLGAKISIESTKGKGTSIVLTLGKRAMNYSGEEQSDTSGDRDLAVQKPTVLIVEDDEINQKTISMFIADKFNVLLADSDKALYETLSAHHVDLIIMDISLKGDKDGLELTKYLKSNEEYASIPIVAATAHAFDTDRQNAKSAGCDDFIAKPFTKTQLLSRIEKLLR